MAEYKLPPSACDDPQMILSAPWSDAALEQIMLEVWWRVSMILGCTNVDIVNGSHMLN